MEVQEQDILWSTLNSVALIRAFTGVSAEEMWRILPVRPTNAIWTNHMLKEQLWKE